MPHKLSQNPNRKTLLNTRNSDIMLSKPTIPEGLISISYSCNMMYNIVNTKKNLCRKHFDNFDPSTVAKFSEEKLLSLKANCSTLLSEQKLRAVVDNANQLLKVQNN